MTYATFTQFIPPNYDYLAKQAQINNSVSTFTNVIKNYADQTTINLAKEEANKKVAPLVGALSIISDIPVIGDTVKIATKTIANSTDNQQLKEVLTPITSKPDFLTNVAPAVGNVLNKTGSVVGNIASGVGNFFGKLGSNIWWIIGGIGVLLLALWRR